MLWKEIETVKIKNKWCSWNWNSWETVWGILNINPWEIRVQKKQANLIIHFFIFTLVYFAYSFIKQIPTSIKDYWNAFGVVAITNTAQSLRMIFNKMRGDCTKDKTFFKEGKDVNSLSCETVREKLSVIDTPLLKYIDFLYLIYVVRVFL